MELKGGIKFQELVVVDCTVGCSWSRLGCEKECMLRVYVHSIQYLNNNPMLPAAIEVRFSNACSAFERKAGIAQFGGGR